MIGSAGRKRGSMNLKSGAPVAVRHLIPAAQYVRMSIDDQRYSIENQKAAILEYAKLHGFEIVRTYADLGKSGIVLKHRTGLHKLLQDVMSTAIDYKVILVYDVSRWGRFQNSDESAHYEFLCMQSGVHLHYCAEQFANDGSPASSILKAMKRSMAAEYSRELGAKVFEGKSRIVKLGFWVGGPPGYGLRRLMVSADGRRKQKLEPGEHKSCTTDRIILVPGPCSEVAHVRRIYSMAVAGQTCTEIAKKLNLDGVSRSGGSWSPTDVVNVLTNPKYTGCNTWNRTSQKLHGNRTKVVPAQWILRPDAFIPIIDQSTFDRVQSVLPRRSDYLWTKEEIIRKLKRLLAKKGRLSDSLIRGERGMPSMGTIRRHLGSYREIYECVGYHTTFIDGYKREQAEPSQRLRRDIVRQVLAKFPKNICLTHLPQRTRSILRVDNFFSVSIVLCRTTRQRTGSTHWRVETCVAERDNISLVVRLTPEADRVESYHVFPKLTFRSHRSYPNDPWLKTGIHLKNLSQFYITVRRLHDSISMT